MSDELKEYLEDESRLLHVRYVNTGNEKYLHLAAEIEALIERLCDE